MLSLPMLAYIVGKLEHEPSEQAYQQLPFGEWEQQPIEEITLDHCIVTSPPTYTKNGKGYLWECIVFAPPDLFHQQQNDTYHLHASAYAKEAHKKRLQPGDVVLLTGTPTYTQEVTLQSGDTQIINHLNVSALTIQTRAQRQTIVVFDAKNSK